MPNITVTLQIDADHAGLHPSKAVTIAATGQSFDAGTQVATTTAANLTIKSSVATLGRAYFYNTSLTDAEIISVGKDVSGTFHELFRVRPNFPPVSVDLVPTGTTYQIKSATGSPELQFMIFEA